MAGRRLLDGFGMAAVSILMPLAAGFFGFVLSERVRCVDCDELDGLREGLLAAGVGLIMGPVVYDALADGRGSLIAAYGGLLLGGLLAVRTDGSGWPLPFLFAGIGYAAADELPPNTTPTVGVWRDGAGSQRLTVGLSGRF